MLFLIRENLSLPSLPSSSLRVLKSLFRLSHICSNDSQRFLGLLDLLSSCDVTKCMKVYIQLDNYNFHALVMILNNAFTHSLLPIARKKQSICLFHGASFKPTSFLILPSHLAHLGCHACSMNPNLQVAQPFLTIMKNLSMF